MKFQDYKYEKVDIEKFELERVFNNLVNLTEKEFKFLAFLVRNKGNVCDRQSIIEQVWDIHFDYDTGVLDVYMNAIRKKLQLEKNELIKTIRGVGFMAIEE